MIDKKRFNKTLAVGWILISLYIFLLALREGGFIKFIGLIGSIIVIIIELTFLIWKK